MHRLSMPEFRQIVTSVMETLPKEFEPYLHNVAVDIAEEPDAEFLRRAGFSEEEIEDGDSLFGFFEPIELPSMFAGDSVHVADLPHRLWIFKNPHEEEF